MSTASLINLCGGSRFETEIQSQIFTGDLTKKVQKATQQIDLFSCIIALIDLQISRLGLEKAADSSIESEDKENTT